MKIKKNLKKLGKFLVDNYFLTIFFISIAFVGIVSIYKIFFTKPTYVYAKVKVGQGLWWASTLKPPVWFVKNIKKGMVARSISGNPVAEILSVRYYPWWGAGQYNIYLTLKLKVTKLASGKYNFNRSAIGVGSPIELEFPQVQFSGTIIDLSEKPFKDKYVEKTITLFKPYAYPWEYNQIKVGDKYFDGEEEVVKIIGKSIGGYKNVILPYHSVIDENFYQTRREIVVELKVKGQMQDGQFVFGEEEVVKLGDSINLETENFVFRDYIVSSIE